MLYQSNFGGYQPTQPEIEENERNLLVDALAASALTAGAGAGGIQLEIDRRKREGGLSQKEALKELKDDAGYAANVLFGKTPFDSEFVNTGNSNFRSVRDLASKDDGFYKAEGATGRETYDPNSGSFVSEVQGASRKNPLTQMAIAMRDAYQPSSEDFLAAEREFRQQSGRSAEGPRSDVAFVRMPLVDAYRDLGSGALPGAFSEEQMEFRRKQGIDLMKANPAQAIGSAAGRTASDFINNGIRSFWWLVNAPQAVSDLASEYTAGRGNNYGLYGQDLYNYDEALEKGMIDMHGNPRNNSINRISDETDDPFLQDQIKEKRKGITLSDPDGTPNPLKKQIFGRRRTGNNLSTLLALPAAIGINAGLGITNPLGGSDGYKAYIPSEDDPTKTKDVLGEVASKYFLGRRGDLLPWEEFKKVRPDVTKDEYMSYKAYKWDKRADLNPFDDGDFNILGGLLKGTDDGIDGGEIRFLGKSMPTDTTLLPTAAAIGGAALGASLGRGGYLNLAGIDEGRQRRAAKRGQIANQYNLEPDFELDQLGSEQRASIRDTDIKALNSIDRQNNRSDAREDRIQSVIDTFSGGKKRPIEQRVKSWDRTRRLSPITLGLAGGFGGLLTAGAIGGEVERRRREDKVRENQLRFD